MALLHIDGFDHYGISGANIDTNLGSYGYTQLQKLAFSSPSKGGTASNVTRSSSGCSLRLRVLSSALTEDYGATVGSFSAGIVAGFACMVEGLKDAPVFHVFGPSNVCVARLYIKQNGSLSILDSSMSESSSNLSVYVSRANVISQNVWNYIEIKVVPGTPGTIIVRVNEEVVLTVSKNTTASTVTSAGFTSNYQVGITSYLGYQYYDDFYVLSIDDTQFGDFLGDRAVVTRMPTSDAGPNTMTATGAVHHYAAVADIPPDGDTSYISGDTVGQEEAYGLPALPNTVMEVSAVMVAGQMKQADGSSIQTVLTAKLDNYETTSPTLYPSTTYGYRKLMMAAAPDGSDWDITKANNLTVGVRVSQ